MKRIQFIKQLLGLSMLPLVGACSATNKDEPSAFAKLRQELLKAWERSETMTMTIVEQMPPELFEFKYIEGAMTFAEQWRHCVIYTCGQIASRLEVENPYNDVKLPVQMPKEDVVKELKNMYAFVRKTIEDTAGTAKLLAMSEIAGEEIPAWRLFYAMENHIIHHRGQCVVYLRLNGIKPKGYYGW